MIISKAPYRISLFGGGSDRPEFIQQHGYAFCINAAINLHNYVSVKKLPPFHTYSTKITYDRIERVRDSRYIFHPVFRECIRFAELEDEPLEINFISDLPGIGLGLGSSSSMIVNLLYAFFKYKAKENIESRSCFDYPIDGKQRLWKDAFEVEQDYMKESVGYQDFWPAVYGGARMYKFDGNKLITECLPQKFTDVINTYGVLFYTGQGRKSSNVFNSYANTATSSHQLKIRELAENALVAINHECRPDMLGYFMRESWRLKKCISPNISSLEIDALLNICRECGYGERLLGAGGGGCIFALIDPDKQPALIDKMEERGCIHVQFSIDNRGVRELIND